MIIAPTHSIANTHQAEAPRATEPVQSPFRVEPVASVRPREERRSSETLANAAALRLGLAAQMLTTQRETVTFMPLAPETRAAARYATVSEGSAQAGTLGFSRVA